MINKEPHPEPTTKEPGEEPDEEPDEEDFLAGCQSATQSPACLLNNAGCEACQ